MLWLCLLAVTVAGCRHSQNNLCGTGHCTQARLLVSAQTGVLSPTRGGSRSEPGEGVEHTLPSSPENSPRLTEFEVTGAGQGTAEKPRSEGHTARRESALLLRAVLPDTSGVRAFQAPATTQGVVLLVLLFKVLPSPRFRTWRAGTEHLLHRLSSDHQWVSAGLHTSQGLSDSCCLPRCPPRAAWRHQPLPLLDFLMQLPEWSPQLTAGPGGTQP